MSGRGRPAQRRRKRKAAAIQESPPLSWATGDFTAEDPPAAQSPQHSPASSDGAGNPPIGSLEHFDAIVPVEDAPSEDVVSLASSPSNLRYDTTAIPVGALLSNSIKEAIRGDKYVDFKKLARQEVGSDSDSDSELVEDDNGYLKRKKKVKKSPLSFLEWQDAFNKFFAARLDGEEGRSLPVAMGLLKHQETVQKLVRARGNWRKYDKSFRRLVECGHAQWGSVKAELYSEAAANVTERPSAQKSARVSTRSCHSFHKLGVCSRKDCIYSHVCYYCKKGSHPASQCYSRTSSQARAPRGRGSFFYSSATSTPSFGGSRGATRPSAFGRGGFKRQLPPHSN